MTDQPQTPEPAEEQRSEDVPATLEPPAPVPAWEPAPAPAWEPMPAWEPEAGASGASAADRPELAVGAAFAGGLVLALILKRLAR